MPTLMTTPPLYRVRNSTSARPLPEPPLGGGGGGSTRREGFKEFSKSRPLSFGGGGGGEVVGSSGGGGGGGGGGNGHVRPNFATIANSKRAKDLLISAPIPIAGSGPRGGIPAGVDVGIRAGERGGVGGSGAVLAPPITTATTTTSTPLASVRTGQVVGSRRREGDVGNRRGERERDSSVHRHSMASGYGSGSRISIAGGGGGGGRSSNEDNITISNQPRIKSTTTTVPTKATNPADTAPLRRSVTSSAYHHHQNQQQQSQQQQQSHQEPRDRSSMRKSWPEAGASTAGSRNKSKMTRNMNLMDLEVLVPPRRVFAQAIPAPSVNNGPLSAQPSLDGSDSGSGRSLRRVKRMMGSGLNDNYSAGARIDISDRSSKRDAQRNGDGTAAKTSGFQVIGRPTLHAPMPPPTSSLSIDSASNRSSSAITDTTLTSTNYTTSASSTRSSTPRPRDYSTLRNLTNSHNVHGAGTHTHTHPTTTTTTTTATSSSRSSSRDSSNGTIHGPSRTSQKTYPQFNTETFSTLSTLALETVYHPTDPSITTTSTIPTGPTTTTGIRGAPPFAPSPPPCSSTITLSTLSDFPPPPSTISPLPAPLHPASKQNPHATGHNVRFDSTPFVIPPPPPMTDTDSGSVDYVFGKRARSGRAREKGGRRAMLRNVVCGVLKTCLLLPPLVCVLLADRVWRRVRGKKGPRKMREVPAVWGVLGMVS